MPTRKTSADGQSSEAKPKKKVIRRKKAPEEIVEAPKVEESADKQEAMQEALAAIKAEGEDIQSSAEDEPVKEDKEEKNGEKSKKKPAKKKTSKKQSKVSMDSVAKARAAEEVVDEELLEEDIRPAYTPTFAERIEDMRDIKPRQTADATFLIPEKFSFDLNEKKKKDKNRDWVKNAAYILGGIIILLVIVLVALTVYSSRLLNQESDLSGINTNQQSEQQIEATQGATYKVGFANIPDDLKAMLASAMAGKLKSAQADSAAQTGLPTVDKDTIFFKASAQPKTTEMLDFLKQLGIKAQIQQSDALPDDLVIYLTSVVKNPDLTTLTAAVYNASGKAGDAKRICGILQNYKVASCQGLNNPANLTGTTIYYKDLKVVFTLKRTTDFSKATFTKAGSDQVEDIRVVAGK